MDSARLKRPLARRALAALPDERLVRLVREGRETAFGETAFEEIVRRYRSPLVAFCCAMVPFHRAEDVVQASLQKAHRALLQGSGEINLRPWLFTIARNGALNAIRDDPHWVELDPRVDGVPQPPAIAEGSERFRELVAAITTLPDAQRRALVKRELEGSGLGEIAAELGTSPGAVRGLIYRARMTVRRTVGLLIPLPLIRPLLGGAPSAAASGGAGSGALAGGGIGVGLGGAKLGAVVVAAAVVAAGSGIAIERSGSVGEARAEAAPSTSRADSHPRGAKSLRTIAERQGPGAAGAGKRRSKSGSGGTSDRGDRDDEDGSRLGGAGRSGSSGSGGDADSSGYGSGSSGSDSKSSGSGNESDLEPEEPAEADEPDEVEEADEPDEVEESDELEVPDELDDPDELEADGSGSG